MNRDELQTLLADAKDEILERHDIDEEAINAIFNEIENQYDLQY